MAAAAKAFTGDVICLGSFFAAGGVTMIQVSTDSRPLRGSLPNCPRLVAAAGSLLTYWTDFGRLIT